LKCAESAKWVAHACAFIDVRAPHFEMNVRHAQTICSDFILREACARSSDVTRRRSMPTCGLAKGLLVGHPLISRDVLMFLRTLEQGGL
jgi:hypothetical protein